MNITKKYLSYAAFGIVLVSVVVAADRYQREVDSKYYRLESGIVNLDYHLAQCVDYIFETTMLYSTLERMGNVCFFDQLNFQGFADKGCSAETFYLSPSAFSSRTMVGFADGSTRVP